MVNYTQIGTLPYPAQSDRPNGPDQFQQLALALEKRIVLRFSNAAARATKITAPTLGILTFRDDDKVYEYWNGAGWVGLDTSVALSTRGTATYSTDRNLTTTESGAIAKSSMTLKNPSKLYNMLWMAVFDMTYQLKWTAPKIGYNVFHYATVGDVDGGRLAASGYTDDNGGSLTVSGLHWPCRTGTLTPGQSISISSWITIKRTNSVTGTATLSNATTDMSVTGVTTV